MSHGLLFIMMLIVFILNVLLQVFKVKVPDKFQYITITAATAIVCLRYKLSMAVVMYFYCGMFYNEDSSKEGYLCVNAISHHYSSYTNLPL